MDYNEPINQGEVMPNRIALKITDQLLGMMTELTGIEENPFEDDAYIVFDVVSPTKFILEFMPAESVFEEYAKDGNLHILQF
jgi:hypothetical protein